MAWQTFKDKGERIYEARLVGNTVQLTERKRVIHHSTQFQQISSSSVRYKSHWHPLRNADDLDLAIDTPAGRLFVYIKGRRITKGTEKLPFVCEWDTAGYLYEKFGY